ncbi:MAG: hypothetical protein C0602_00020 [Denitrovibrio sp.]|nr:MAG: hypothetical protein C0602_00020 [Denitrovibrio sp.]
MDERLLHEGQPLAGKGFTLQDCVVTEKFWMVLQEGSTYTKVKHDSYEKARDEAKRLAKKEAGKKFYVLGCEALVQVEMPEPTVIKAFPMPTIAPEMPDQTAGKLCLCEACTRERQK